MLQFYLSLIENWDDHLFFEKMYNKYRDQMYRLAYHFLENEEDARDIVHDVFTKIAISHMDVVKSINNPIDLRNYLLTCVKHASLNQIKRNNIEQTLFVKDTTVLDNLPDLADGDFTKQVCSASDYDEIVDVINSLDSHYREVLNAHFVLELSVKDTAKVLDIKESTAKTWLVRGKKLLLSKLGKGDKNKNGNN